MKKKMILSLLWFMVSAFIVGFISVRINDKKITILITFLATLFWCTFHDWLISKKQ